MEDNLHKKEQQVIKTKQKSVVSLFLGNQKEESQKDHISVHEARKTLFSESMYAQKLKDSGPQTLRRTSINDYETKSLRDYEPKSSRSRISKLNKTKENLQIRMQDTEFDYNENLFRLKIEEITFKFKTRIGILLRQMNTSVTELSKFTDLNKIDDILDCLTERVKEMMRLNETRSSNNEKGKNKDQEIINHYQIQIESLQKKLLDRQNAEKGYKERLKETHHQIRELYDRLNRREKEYSSKMTELYQIKTLNSESEKLIHNLTTKCFNLQKESTQLRENQLMQDKKVLAQIQNLKEENQELKQRAQQLSDLNDRFLQKESKLLELNRQLNDQLERWRERFESQDIQSKTITQRQESSRPVVTASTIDIKEGNSFEGSKVNQMTLLNENSRLSLRLNELQRQNRELSRQLSTLANIRTKYNELVLCLNSQELGQSSQQMIQNSGRSKQISKQSFIFQVEFAYKKKIEENAKQWREKLVELVNTYEEEIQSHRIQNINLLKSKDELQLKIHELANQKYQAQSLLIEKERQIYELSKTNRQSCRVISSLQFSRVAKREEESPLSVEKEVFRGQQGESGEEES